MKLFNRTLLRKNRDRIVKQFANANFIHQETSKIIIDTVADCKRNFDNILEIGARDGSLGKEIAKVKNSKQLIQADCSSKMVVDHNLNLVMDEELPCFKDQTFDLIVSNLNLHLINDLPKNLTAMKRLLKPNGLIISSFFGEENLKQLKNVVLRTEQEIYGGITPRIMPNIDIKTAGMLMQKVGFINSVAEKHSFEVIYKNPMQLLLDIKNMGESNILNNKTHKFITKNFLFDLTSLYQKLYCNQHNQSFATFEIIILVGWKHQ